MNLEHIESLLGRYLHPYEAAMLTCPGKRRIVLIPTPRRLKASDWAAFDAQFGQLQSQGISRKNLKALGLISSAPQSYINGPNPSTARGYSGTTEIVEFA